MDIGIFTGIHDTMTDSSYRAGAVILKGHLNVQVLGRL